MGESNFSNFRNNIVKLQSLADDIIKNKEKTTYIDWKTYDSHLIDPEYSAGMSFNHTFFQLCPEKYKNIKEYIETELKDEDYVVLLEVGGTASNLTADFSEGFIDESIGYALTDTIRSAQQIKKETEKGHTVMTGNAFSSQFLPELRAKLGNKKVNIFFERMLGGHVGIEENIKFFSETFNRWYRLLADKAISFVESPIIDDLENIACIQKTLDGLKNVSGLDVSYGTSRVGHGVTFWIRLQRDKTAPADLRPYLKN